MNHVYRSLYNLALGVWIAAPETASSRGKPSRSRGGAVACAATLLSLLPGVGWSLPTDGVVSAGSGSISQSGATMTVTQSSQNLAINWNTFNIGAGETVNFVQPNSSAIALNRVLGTDGSQILGKLNANGQVWILNPNGVLFGKTAQVSVGGLVASTLGISDADFLAGKRVLAGTGGGSVVNQGSIQANQYVAFISEQVRNEGSITADGGTVALTAANKVTLDFNGDKLLNIEIDEGALQAQVENKGLLQADGGLVLLSAQAKDALLDTAVNNTGIIRARSLDNVSGRILLLGDMSSGSVNVGGTLDASAPSGGDGGFVETSAAHVKVADSATVTTQAAQGATGTWLIDPVDFTVAASGGDMTGTAVSNALASNNFTIQSSSGSSGTSGNVNINDTVSWSSHILTLNAQNNININAVLNGSGTAGLALEYGASYNIYAAVNLASTGSFSTKQGSGTVKNYTIITSLGVMGSTIPTDLQGIYGGLSGDYVLGSNIDASATSGWEAGAGFLPIGADPSLSAGAAFSGIFDGLGHTISNLTINRSGTDYVGLFGYTLNAQIMNVGLVGASIRGQANTGGLVGRLQGGSVSNSYVTGSVSGSMQVGGLVGTNLGSVSNSYATATVSGSSYAGGLAGINGNGSSMSNSYATGAVSGSAHTGGLVGYNLGSVTNSYWNTETSGQASSAAGTGKTTAQMQQLSTYSSWSIDDAGGTTSVWRIYDGYTTPLLRSFLTSLTVTANDASANAGSAYSGGNGVTYSTAASVSGTVSYSGTSQGASSVGSYTLIPGGLYSNQSGYDIKYVNGTLTLVAGAAATSSGANNRAQSPAVVAAQTHARIEVSGKKAGEATTTPLDLTQNRATSSAANTGAANGGLASLLIVGCGQAAPENATVSCR